MIQSQRKDQKPIIIKTPEQEIKELKQELDIKQLEMDSLQKQVGIVQSALDDLILGGML